MEVRIESVGGSWGVVRFYQDGKFVGRADCNVEFDGEIKLISYNQHGQKVQTTVGDMKYCEKE